MKILGADWKAFMAALPDCYYFEDTDSPDDFADTDTIEITCGVICWQGWRSSEQKDPVVPGVISKAQAVYMQEREFIDLLCTFTRWKKSQTVERLVMEVQKTDVEGVKAALTGYRVRWL